MSPETLVGALTLAAGLLVIAVSGVGGRVSLRRSRLRFTARVAASGDFLTAVHTETGQRFALMPSNLPQALHDGDLVDVVPAADGRTATIYYRVMALLSYGYLAEGAVLTLVGAWCLVAGVRGGFFADSGEVVAYLVPMLFCLSVGPLAVALLLTLLHTLVRSHRVHGTVIDVEEVLTPKKMTYQPLVEYHVAGGMRRAWGAPQWTRPAIGSTATARVSERAQGHAIPSSPLVLFGLVMTLLMGGTGLAGLGTLIAATLP